jgi:hypothetical protein
MQYNARLRNISSCYLLFSLHCAVTKLQNNVKRHYETVKERPTTAPITYLFSLISQTVKKCIYNLLEASFKTVYTTG